MEAQNVRTEYLYSSKYSVDPQPKITVATDPVLCYDGDADFNITNLTSVSPGGQWRYDVCVYPAGVTGDWAGGYRPDVTGMAALTDNLLNSTMMYRRLPTHSPRI